MHVLLPETMTELNYEGNHLDEINPLVFVGKVHLQKLNLARNNLQKFTNETFCSAKNLHEINFRTNPQLMNIASVLNELFACLKALEYIYLSHEQIHGEISSEWITDDYGEFVRLKRTTKIQSTTTTVFSIVHEEFYATTNFIDYHQAFLLLLFFLLLFLLLFSLLLISLAICRRKLRELQLKRTELFHSNYLPPPPPPLPLPLPTASMKLPASQPTTDSLYEQLPSLSSDSEQPFLYQDKPTLIPPALPPYPPVLVYGNCSNEQQPPILCQCVDRQILYREKVMNKN